MKLIYAILLTSGVVGLALYLDTLLKPETIIINAERPTDVLMFEKDAYAKDITVNGQLYHFRKEIKLLKDHIYLSVRGEDEVVDLYEHIDRAVMDRQDP